MDFRFWFWVDVQGEDSCWPWLGTPSQKYGKYIPTGSKMVSVHRYAWSQFNGKIPGEMYVCHSCDVPRCCNPAHLWLGTNRDNQLDSIQKGRSGSRYPPAKLGEEHHSSKLTADQVQQIRFDYDRSLISQDMLAEQYEVTQTMISKIVLRKSWKHI